MFSPISFTNIGIARKESRYSDVDDIMMVTILRCWGHSHYIGDFVPMLVTFSKVSVSNIPKLSSTFLTVSNIIHLYNPINLPLALG